MNDMATDAVIISERKITREHVLRDKVKIRLATDQCGQQIAVILAENGVVLQGADWSKIFPYWLIATVGDDIIGCVQLMRGKPVGFMEFLFVRPSAPFKTRVIAVQKLLSQGFSTLQMDGACYAAAGVSPENEKFIAAIEKIGAFSMGSRITMVRRLT